MNLRQQAVPFLDALDESVLAGLRGRSMLLTDDWSRDEIEAVCHVAETLQLLDRRGVATRLLPHELHYALFFDNSTRTRSSWAGAAVRLGAHPMVVDGTSTQVAHGETPEETGAMLGMNAHALGIRHDLIVGEGNRFMRGVKEGIDAYLRHSHEHRTVPIVNLQCDIDHPTFGRVPFDRCCLRRAFDVDPSCFFLFWVRFRTSRTDAPTLCHGDLA